MVDERRDPRREAPTVEVPTIDVIKAMLERLEKTTTKGFVDIRHDMAEGFARHDERIGRLEQRQSTNSDRIKENSAEDLEKHKALAAELIAEREARTSLATDVAVLKTDVAEIKPSIQALGRIANHPYVRLIVYCLALYLSARFGIKGLPTQP